MVARLEAELRVKSQPSSRHVTRSPSPGRSRRTIVSLTSWVVWHHGVVVAVVALVGGELVDADVTITRKAEVVLRSGYWSSGWATCHRTNHHDEYGYDDLLHTSSFALRAR